MSAFSRLKTAAPATALAALLAACGGGGGGDTSTSNPDTGPGGDIARPVPGQARANCTLRYSLTGLPPAGSGADPRLSEQWHLQPGGTDALAVWARPPGIQGSGVRVAVVDDAVETVHEDLAPNVVAGASHNYLDGSAQPLPCTAEDDHGTSVAGIIAARDANGVGVAGVSPRAALVGYNALASSSTADIADAMTRGLRDNAIVHNSWGSPDDGTLNPSDTLWESAVRRGVRDGRDGRGTVYMFAAGNGGTVRVPQSGALITENSNFDGFVNKLGVNAICAVGRDGRSPGYAEPGANILVCGPSSGGSSGVVTTNIQNAYRADFGGTSAATPMASGVAALVMQTRPELTWRDVRLILARSARKNDPGDAGWMPSALPGDKQFHHRYGFGTVDAGAAVALASNWPSVGGWSTLQSCGPYNRSPNLAIPDAGGTLGAPVRGAPVADAVAVPADCPVRKIEFVEVSFTSNHPYWADLDVRLVSPAGRTSVLADTRFCGAGVSAANNPCAGAAYAGGWQFGSVRHLDESAAGTWQLVVADGTPNDLGTLGSWSVRFWGRQE